MSVERDGVARRTYTTLDDEQTLLAALEEPGTFLSEQRYPMAIDEMQLGGDAWSAPSR